MPLKKLTTGDVGVAVGDLPALVDVGGGVAGLPAVDGSLLTGISGSGDVSGPASSVNLRIAVFSGTTGKTIADGGVAIAGLQPISSVLTNTTASFTTAQQTKLSGIAAGATVGADWNTNLLNIPAFGTAALLDAGVATGDLVQLEDVGGEPGLPAVDGSQLLNLPGGGGGDYFTLQGSAYVGGLQTGNARGSGALDVQSARALVTQVAAGANSMAFGYNNELNSSGSIGIGSSNFNGTGVNCILVGISNTSRSNYNQNGFNSFAAGKSNGIFSDSVSCVGIQNVCAGPAGGNAFGRSNVTYGGYDPQAFGAYNTTIGYRASAFGISCNVTGTQSIAFGQEITVEGDESGAFGFNAYAVGDSAWALGYKVSIEGDGILEIGNWPTEAARGGSIRLYDSGNINFTVAESDTAFTDGGSTPGSEVDGTVFRGGLGFRFTTGGSLIITRNDASGNITESAPIAFT